MRRPYLLLALGTVLALITVWQRAAILGLGAEVAALRSEAQRLDEEQQGLRMSLARLTSPAALGAATQDGWAFQDARTREVIQRVRDARQPPSLRADARR